MSFWDIFPIAVRGVARNKMRAALTVLGIVIGIAAVTTMVSLGQSAGDLVQSQVETLGTNVIVLFPAARRSGGVQQGRATTLTAADAAAIVDQCPTVLATSPLVFTAGQVIYGNANWNPAEMLGVGPDYLLVRKWPLRLGTFFGDRDMTAAAKKCIVGQTLVAKLFQTRDPIGQSLRVNNIPFEVVGVLEAKGANLFGEDQDSILLMPYTTVRKRLQGSNFNEVNGILVSARARELISDAAIEIDQLLYERHRIPPGEEPDFVVRNMEELSNLMGIITGTLTLMLSAIAAISLLVGGVGVMNIMLVSVTERTREIGIRMAVGATAGDILRQFLMEAIVLCTIGGLLGVLLGIGAAVLATQAINRVSSGADWPVVISFPAAAIALTFAAAVGIFFGYYPARRASRLDPIEALRYE